MILPKICFGTYGIGEDLTDYNMYLKYKNALECALLEGIRFFDTAENYAEGHAEELLGVVVKSMRQDVIIATKIAPEHTISRWAIESSIARSLKRLDTDYIDIYQIHWPHPMHDTNVIISTLRDAIKAGKIRKVGLCNHSLSQQAVYGQYLGNDLISIQDEFNLVDNTSASQMLPGKYLLAYSTLKHTKVSSKVYKFVNALMKKYKLTDHQIILSWVASFNKCIPVFTSLDVDHIKENLAIFNASTPRLEDDDITTLSALSKTHDVWLDTSLMTRFDVDQTYCPSPVDLEISIRNAERLKPIKVSRNLEGTYTVVEGKVRFLAYKNTSGMVPAIILGE